MSDLLQLPPYYERDDVKLLEELNQLTLHHTKWCTPYRLMMDSNLFDKNKSITCIEDIPFVHIGIFKRLVLKTLAPDTKFIRTAISSATSGDSSLINIDKKSALLQSQSTTKILTDFIGLNKRPLLILDSSSSLRVRDNFSARIMAAMSLEPFASNIFFLLKDSSNHLSLEFQNLENALEQDGEIIVYGFSWILWLVWSQAKTWPISIRKKLFERPITFIHSGGWKKLENKKVDRVNFDTMLLNASGYGSRVIDYYGLVEQMGIIFPLCPHGSRHIPRWADVLVREPHTHSVQTSAEGQLQIINAICWGSPCFSVLTEDIGRLHHGACGCGRMGRHFELIGRLQGAEIRGCGNV